MSSSRRRRFSLASRAVSAAAFAPSAPGATRASGRAAARAARASAARRPGSVLAGVIRRRRLVRGSRLDGVVRSADALRASLERVHGERLEECLVEVEDDDELLVEEERRVVKRRHGSRLEAQERGVADASLGGAVLGEGAHGVGGLGVGVGLEVRAWGIDGDGAEMHLASSAGELHDGGFHLLAHLVVQRRGARVGRVRHDARARTALAGEEVERAEGVETPPGFPESDDGEPRVTAEGLRGHRRRPPVRPRRVVARPVAVDSRGNGPIVPSRGERRRGRGRGRERRAKRRDADGDARLIELFAPGHRELGVEARGLGRARRHRRAADGSGTSPVSA